MTVLPAMWDAMSSWLTPTMLFLFLNFIVATIFVTSRFTSHKQPPSPSSSPSHRQPDSTPEHVPIQRSASLLQRLKSVNFYQYATFNRSHRSADEHDHDDVVSPRSSFSYEAQSPEMEMEMEKEKETVVYPTIEEDDRVVYPSIDEGYDEDEDRIVYPTIEDDSDYEEEDDVVGEKSIDEVYSELQRASHHSRTKSDMEPSSGAATVKLVKKMKKSASSKSAFRHFEEADILEARRPATVREVKKAAASEAAEDEEVDSKADDFINKFKNELKLQRLDSILRYKEMLGRGAEKSAGLGFWLEHL